MASFWATRNAKMQAFPPAPPHRMESMHGPVQSNWLVRDHLLAGPHPGPLSTEGMVANLSKLLEAGVTTFVCLQHDMPSTGASGSQGAKLRSTFGGSNVVTATPYAEDARLIAEAGRMPQVTGPDGRPLSYIHFPIGERDGATTKDEDVAQFALKLLSHIKAGEVLYLQCHDGNGRTGTIGSILLGLVYGMSSSEAIDACQRSRSHRQGTKGLCPETHEQKMQVHRLLNREDFRRQAASVAPRHSGDKEEEATEDASSIAAQIRAQEARIGTATHCYLRRHLESQAALTGGSLSAAQLLAALGSFRGGSIRLSEEHARELVEHVVGLERAHGGPGGGGAGAAALSDFIRGELSPARRAAIHAAFAKMDVSGTGQVSMDDVAVLFNAKAHPQVLAGRRGEEEVLREFLETFGVQRRGRRVHVSEFEDYYADISAGTEDDNAFAMAIWAVWGLEGQAPGTGGPSSSVPSSAPTDAALGKLGDRLTSKIRPASGMQTAAQAATAATQAAATQRRLGLSVGKSSLGYSYTRTDDPAPLLGKLRDMLVSCGPLAVAVLRERMLARDEDGDGAVHEGQWRAALEDVGMTLSPPTSDAAFLADAVFGVLARESPTAGRPVIVVEEFHSQLRGRMNAARRALVVQAWERLERAVGGGDAQGAIPLEELGARFVPQGHPTVRAGRRTQEAIMGDFLQALGQGEAPYPGSLGPTPGSGMSGRVVRLPYFELLMEGVSCGASTDEELGLVLWSCFDTKPRGAVGSGGSHGVGGGAPRTPSRRGGGAGTAASLTGRARTDEDGILRSMTRLGSQAAGLDHSYSAKAQFVSHPAMQQNAQVAGTGAASTAAMRSPYATRAGYGMGPAMGKRGLGGEEHPLQSPAGPTAGARAAAARRGPVGLPDGLRAAAEAEHAAEQARLAQSPRAQARGDDYLGFGRDRGRRRYGQALALQESQQALQSFKPDAPGAAPVEEELRRMRQEFRFSHGGGGAGGAPTTPGRGGGSGGPSNGSGGAGVAASAVARIRGRVVPRGLRGVVGFAHALGVGLATSRELGDLPSESLCSPDDLSRRLSELGVGLSPEELASLEGAFRDPATGAVACGQLARAVMGELSPQQKGLVAKAYDKLMAEAQAAAGVDTPVRAVPVSRCRETFDPSAHPECASGRRQEADVLREFLETFYPDAGEEAPVRLGDFEAWHAALAATLGSEGGDFFAVAVWGGWRMQSDPRAGAGGAPAGALTGTQGGPVVGSPFGSPRGVVPAGAVRRHEEHVTGGGAPVVRDMRKMSGGGHAAGGGSMVASGWGIEREGYAQASVGEMIGGRAGAGEGSTLAYRAASSRDPALRAKAEAEAKAMAGGEADPVQYALQRLRGSMARRGPDGFIKFARIVRGQDGSRRGALTGTQFKGALEKAGLGCTDGELGALFVRFDAGAGAVSTGLISVGAFLQGLAGKPAPFRLALVDRAFRRLDRRGTGTITTSDLARAYQARHLSSVKSGRQTAQEALEEFLLPFREQAGVGPRDEAPVSRAQWNESFALLSAGIEDDSYFQLMMWNTWGLGGGN